MITPYLNITLPDVLATSGSTYATEINNAFLVFDQLLGTGFTPASLNINQDLDFQTEDAINLRSVRFVNNGSAVNQPTDVGCAYEYAGNLWYNDSAGNQIPITLNGNLNTGINGNIGGLAGTSASVSFNSVSNAYSFYAAPNRYANLNAATGTFGAVYVSGTLYAAQATITSASYGSINTLTGSLVQATVVSGGTGNFNTLNANTLNATNGTITSFNCTSANTAQENVTQLTASGGKITGNLSASSIQTPSITAATVTTPNLNASNASLGSANATSVNATSVTATGPTTVTGTLNVVGTTTLGSANANSVGASSVTATSVSATNLTATGNTSLQSTTANVLNVSSNAQVTGTLTVGAQKVVINPGVTNMLSCSGDIVANGGFRQQVGPATIYDTTATLSAGTYNLRQVMSPSNSNLQFQWVAPFNGSVVAIQVTYVLPTSGVTYTVILTTVARQVAETSPLATFATSNPTNLTGYVTTFPKDSKTFAPGDVLNFTVQTSATTNNPLAAFVWMTVEC